MATVAGRSFVGCSGWMYRDWRGLIYPKELPTRSWLAWYAEHFSTVEVNNSFYRLPAATAVEGWAGAVPDGFTFAIKLGAFGSHRKKLADPTTWLPKHLERFQPLAAKQGPTLVQLPPRWRRNVERLDEVLAAVPRGMRWAVEVRDASWLHDDVFEVLRRHDAALCVHDLLDDHPTVLTTEWTYVRFHGPQATTRAYHGSYGKRGLARRAAWMGELLDAGRDVYAYFNNDVHGEAFHDGRRLTEMLKVGTAP